MSKVDFGKYFDAKKNKEVINRLNKKFKTEKAVVGNDKRSHFAVLPTYSIGLNRKMGGGFRRRKVQLSYGEKSVGKSFGDYKNTAVLQRLCRHCLGILPFEDKLCEILKMYFLYQPCNCSDPKTHRICRIDYESDYEYVSDPEDTEVYQNKKSHSERIGVIPEFLTVIFASSMEECIDIVKDVIPNKEFDYISVDSLQGSQSNYVFDKDGDDQTMGVDAKMLTRMLKDVSHGFHKGGVEDFLEMPTVHVISQMRMKMGQQMAFSTFSGGKALEHNTGAILKWNRINYITMDGNPVTSLGKNDLGGIKVGYKNEKSKVGVPYFSGEVELYFRDIPKLEMEHGDVNYLLELIDLGIESGTIQQAGAFYTIAGEKFKGKVQLNSAVREDSSLVSAILANTTDVQNIAEESSEEEDLPDTELEEDTD